MQLGDLLSIPHLGLRFLTGDAQQPQPLRGVYTTDLLRPSRYLVGGELVLTGMMWRASPQDSDTFVLSVAEGSAAAIGAGTALGTVPTDLIDACHRHDVPLLEVPAATSFGVITEEVLRLLNRKRATAIAQTREHTRTLMSEIASGADFTSVFPEAAGHHDLESWVVSSTGQPVATAGPELSAPTRSLITQRALAAPSFPCRVRPHPAEQADTQVLSIVPIQTQQSHPLSRWLLVCAGDHHHWGTDTEDTVTELVSLVALARNRTEERAAYRARLAEDLPHLLEQQRSDEVATLLRASGMRDHQDVPHMVVSVELVPEPPLSDLARRITAELLSGYPEAIVTGDNDVVAVVTVSDETTPGEQAADTLRTTLETRLHTVTGGLGQYRLHTGVSATARRLDELRGAAQEARHARLLARQRTGRAPVVTGTEIDTYELLLASVPSDVRETYRDRLLGALLEYDRTHRSALVRTLECFLQHSGSWQRCAEAMHLHVSTLRYRIGRVQDLTGRDLSRWDHRTDLLLALRLRP